MSNTIIFNISMFAGETPSFGYTALNSIGIAFNITGAQITFVLYTGTNAYAPVQATKTVGNGIVILTQSGGTLGQYQVSLSESDTLNTSGTFYYQTAISIGGYNAVVAYGQLTISQSQAF